MTTTNGYKQAYWHTDTEAIAAEYNKATEKNALISAAFNNTGGADMHDPQVLDAKMNEIKTKLHSEACSKIDAIKTEVQKLVDNNTVKIERDIIKIMNGDTLAAKYSSRHKIPIEEARTELDRYAANVKIGFKGGLADQYAAIKHRNMLKPDSDLEAANRAIQAERNELQIDKRQHDLDSYRMFAEKDAYLLLKEANSGANAMLKLIKS